MVLELSLFKVMKDEAPSKTLTAVSEMPSGTVGMLLLAVVCVGLLWIVERRLTDVAEQYKRGADAVVDAAAACQRFTVAMESVAESDRAENQALLDLVKAVRDKP
jgi:hypothetical protein